MKDLKEVLGIQSDDKLVDVKVTLVGNIEETPTEILKQMANVIKQNNKGELDEYSDY